ncbi:PaaI family thioesterase [Jatrophihabitans telluris]|uniref:PaaI family thioesterase n=1 Tax=Jatrophihabitans telluris TaxID=2038343 RepID=A0ABY4QZD0_9ACTN|nr:PaaI family thioesterase [Jatrophihabitans telluris]UQX88567.1 PaaI family thioesterase [Jatrophihabitans telluris]
MQLSNDQILALVPFTAFVGVIYTELTPERVVAALAVTPERTTIGGGLHGGALMTLADSAAAALATLNLPQGAAGTVTIDSATHFLGAARSGTVTAAARLLHSGRTTIVAEVDLTDDAGRLIGRTTQVQAVLAGAG